MGFEAYPVLLSSSGGVEESLPSVRQFDHEIAALRQDGKWTFLDLTAEVVPFGQIPPSYQGEFGLVVFDDGSVEEVTFPKTAPADNLRDVKLTGEIHEDGSLSGWYTEEASGNLQYRLRGALSQQFSDKDLERLKDAVANSVIEGATGDSLSIFDGRDLHALPEIKVRLNAERAARRTAAADTCSPSPSCRRGTRRW